jgi:hypothetical protein
MREQIYENYRWDVTAAGRKAIGLLGRSLSD